MRERMPNSIKALAIALGFDVIAYWICLTFLDLQDATMVLVTMVAAVVEMALIILGAVIVIRDKKNAGKRLRKKERLSKGGRMSLMAAIMLLGVEMALTALLCFTDFMAGRVAFTVALAICLLICVFVLLFLSLRSGKPRR